MKTRQDLPLKNDIAARFVPQIVAAMVFLGTLCFTFSLFVLHTTHSWEKSLSTNISIEISPFAETPPSALQPRVVSLLEKTQGIKAFEIVPQKDLSTLVSSLLGNDIDVNQFFLPIIIDVTFEATEKVDLKKLDLQLKDISPSIQMVDQQQWQGQVTNLLHISLLLSMLITLLIMGVALMTTIFATRTSLLIHRQVVEVLNLIGATNLYIANQFQTYAFKQGLIASALGSFFAFLTFMGGMALLSNANFAVDIYTSFFIQALFIFVLAPFVTATAMMLAARFAVMKALTR